MYGYLLQSPDPKADLPFENTKEMMPLYNDPTWHNLMIQVIRFSFSQ